MLNLSLSLLAQSEMSEAVFQMPKTRQIAYLILYCNIEQVNHRRSEVGRDPRITQSIFQMVHELWQAWSCDHFSGELSLVTNHPLSEMHFPNIQPEFSHIQLHIISMSLLLVMTFWLLEHTVDSSSACYQSQPPDPFLHSCSSASHPPVCTCKWDYLILDAESTTCSC